MTPAKPRKRKLPLYIFRCDNCGKKQRRKMGGGCRMCGEGMMQRYERIET